jgi:hypothetical protein
MACIEYCVPDDKGPAGARIDFSLQCRKVDWPARGEI